MDHLDYEILKNLKENARMKASDISKAVHLSVSTVIERIRKMEALGIIESYTVITQWIPGLAMPSTALIEVTWEHPTTNDSFVERCQESIRTSFPYYYLTGDSDYILKVACRSPEHLEHIHQWVKGQAGVCQTRTHYVLRTEKNIHATLPPGDDSA
ncbi:MAG: Lrp/AsnC family transcriptional regulator [[Clostridium] scindens]